jgi:hypothetical protein
LYRAVPATPASAKIMGALYAGDCECAHSYPRRFADKLTIGLTAHAGEVRRAMSQLQHRRDFLRTTLGALGLWTLTGCGADGGADSSGGLTPPDSTAQLFPVTTERLSNIRLSPQTFLYAYSLLGGKAAPADYVRSKLGAAFASLTDEGCLATFASLIAFDCAPYGSTQLAPLTATLGELLSSQALACGHYCKLATVLTLLGYPALIPPDAPAGSPPKPTLHFLVWVAHQPLNDGVHSQLILSNVLDEAYLLLDPTYAYALRIPFVGAGPQASLTVIQNAATMMQTPIAQENLVVLNAAGTANVPQMLTTLISGELGPEYVLYDPLYGSDGWDAHVAQIYDSFGSPAPLQPHHLIGPNRDGRS